MALNLERLHVQLVWEVPSLPLPELFALKYRWALTLLDPALLIIQAALRLRFLL